MHVDIPKSEQQLLREWMLGPKKDELDGVLAALSELKPALSHVRLAEQVATKLGLDVTVASALVKALINLCVTYWRLHSEYRAEQTPSILLTAIGGGPEDTEPFTLALDRVVQDKVLEVTGKALGVLNDNPNTFCAARTLSEIRPIFEEHELQAEAVVILHQLKIEYHEGPDSTRREIFIAMDKQDLELLRAVVERALTKHERLSTLTTPLNLPIL